MPNLASDVPLVQKVIHSQNKCQNKVLLTKLAHGNCSGYFQELKEVPLPYKGNDEHPLLIYNIHQLMIQKKVHLLMNKIQLPVKDKEKNVVENVK